MKQTKQSRTMLSVLQVQNMAHE